MNMTTVQPPPKMSAAQTRNRLIHIGDLIRVSVSLANNLKCKYDTLRKTQEEYRCSNLHFNTIDSRQMICTVLILAAIYTIDVLMLSSSTEFLLQTAMGGINASNPGLWIACMLVPLALLIFEVIIGFMTHRTGCDRYDEFNRMHHAGWVTIAILYLIGILLIVGNSTYILYGWSGHNVQNPFLVIGIILLTAVLHGAVLFGEQWLYSSFGGIQHSLRIYCDGKRIQSVRSKINRVECSIRKNLIDFTELQSSFINLTGNRFDPVWDKGTWSFVNRFICEGMDSPIESMSELTLATLTKITTL